MEHWQTSMTMAERLDAAERRHNAREFNAETLRWYREIIRGLPTALLWARHYRPDGELDASLFEAWEREYDPSLEASAR